MIRFLDGDIAVIGVLGAAVDPLAFIFDGEPVIFLRGETVVFLRGDSPNVLYCGRKMALVNCFRPSMTASSVSVNDVADRRARESSAMDKSALISFSIFCLQVAMDYDMTFDLPKSFSVC